MIWNVRKQKTTNQNKKKKESKRNEDSVSSIWDFKHSNIHIIGVPEREEKEQEIGKVMKENSPNLVTEIDIQVQEAQRWMQTRWMQRGSHQARHN